MGRNSTEAKARYSDVLRNMFQEINPYNLSCLYKETFEAHATDVLRVADEKSSALSTRLHETNDARVSVDTEECCDPQQQRIEDCTSDNFKSNTSKFCIQDFYNKLHSGSTDTNLKNEVTGWNTCGLSHNGAIDVIVKNYRGTTEFDKQWYPSLTRSLYSSSSSGCTGCTRSRRQRHLNWNHSNRANVSSSASEDGVCQNETSDTGDKGHFPYNSAHVIDVYEKKAKGQKTTVKKPRGTSSRSRGRPASAAVDARDKVRRTSYFQHDRSRAEVLVEYKQRCNQKSPVKRNVSPAQVTSVSRRNVPYPSQSPVTISKAGVHCQDVRQGACIRPSVKLAHFQFMVNCRWRTSQKRATNTKNKNMTKDKQKIGPATGVSVFQNQPVERVQSLACSTPMTVTQTSPVSSPYVCRSRPSIPSNARGIVCDTAVETPSHVVQCITGHSLQNKTSRPPSSGDTSPSSLPRAVSAEDQLPTGPGSVIGF